MPMVWADRSGALFFAQVNAVTKVTIEIVEEMGRLQKPYFFSFS
jgi:hypothetical protein